jgi:hypothetical protein
LASGETGVGFVYSALEMLATRFELRDAVIVLENESVGLQIFRLGHRDVSVELAAKLGKTPGLVCLPDVVPADEVDAVRQACQRALSTSSARFAVPDVRAALSAALVVVDVVTFVLTVADIHGPARFFFGLALGVAVPGWSVVGLLRLKNAALEVGLTIATSLSMIMILAQVMITVSLWHPVALEEIVCLLCLPSLIVQARALTRQPVRRR